MSFILEALKKSEEQRQKNAASPKKVGARRLSFNPYNSPYRPYWLLATVLLLFISGGWWHFRTSESIQEPPLVVEMVESPHPANNQFKSPKSAVITELESTPKTVDSEIGVIEPTVQPTPVVEAAPVPRTLTRPASSRTKAQSETIITEVLPPQEEPSTLPLYTDLSMELRQRMPRLDMSMHFYTPVSTRRLVRINNSLLREGDWVSGEVEILEITPSGVILDFLGKNFKLNSDN